MYVCVALLSILLIFFDIYVVMLFSGNVCVDGYALAADNSCTECKSSSTVLIVSLLASFVVFTTLVCFWKRHYLISLVKAFIVYFEEKTKYYDMKSFKTKGKILFSFYQIISFMPTALNLFYPNPFSYALEFFSVTNINIISLFSLGCIFSSNFFNKLRWVQVVDCFHYSSSVSHLSLCIFICQ